MEWELLALDYWAESKTLLIIKSSSNLSCLLLLSKIVWNNMFVWHFRIHAVLSVVFLDS